MIQVDVFWSYGVGASFAWAAKKQLMNKPPSRDGGGLLGNPFFSTTIFYLATFLAPSGLYLLWQFTSWETMHALDKTMPAWLVTAFAATIVTQGMLGFWVTYKLNNAGRHYMAFLQPMLGYFLMFFILAHGWDGTGYQRVFSENRAIFENWTPAHITTWLLSDVSLTLGITGAVLIPPMLYWLSSWAEEGLAMAGSRWGDIGKLPIAAGMLAVILGPTFAAAVVASLAIHWLGWAGGILTFAMIAYAVLVGPKSILRFVFNKFDPDAKINHESSSIIAEQSA